MRRDVYIENDSGGFSVVAADAVDAIIEDGRSDDFKFVKDYKALLLELYGDDSMPVRIVVDEPLTPDEEAQWLGRVTWQIETTDGKMLVMGGFDPDVLSWWKEGSSATHGDGRGVGAVMASPGKWKVDVYAHVGSMNGRVILDEAGFMAGAEFRRSHPERPFPLWLAHMLDYSGAEDPGHEELWKDIKGNYASGKLAVDADGSHAIGFLVHFTRATTPPGDPPGEVWFGRSDNSRIPKVFPLGLASEVPDPSLKALSDKLLDRKPPPEVRPIATDYVDVIDGWEAQVTKIEGDPIPIDPAELYLLYWMAGLTAYSPPLFEIRITGMEPWIPPASTADFAVVPYAETVFGIGPVSNTGGWHTWWTARDAAKALVKIPDGTVIDFAMAPRAEETEEERNPEVGLARYRGKVIGGKWAISQSSPTLPRATLEQALAFARDMTANEQIRAASPAERDVLNAEAVKNFLKEGDWIWDGDILRLKEPEERYLIMLAEPIFRERFKNAWPMAIDEDLDDEDDE